jgi:hypothetical protein
MQNNQIDRIFKNKLEQLKPDELDLRHWEEARKMLAEKKKDRKGFYFLLVGILLLSLSGWYYFNLKKEKQDVPEKVRTPVEMALIPEKDPDSNFSLSDLNDTKNAVANDTDSRQHFVSSRPGLRSARSGGRESRSPGSSGITADTDHVTEEIQEMATIRDLPVREADRTLTPLTAVDFQLSNDLSIQPEDEVPIFREKPIKRRRMGWSGTLLINPAYSHPSPVHGLTLGFVYEQYLKKNWLIGMRPSIHLRNNEGGFTKFEQVTTFGFSANSKTFGLKADNLQFVSAPLYLAGEFGKHTFETGISIDLLLGARGQLQEVAIEDQAITNLRSLDSGWIKTDDMKRFSANFFLGYQNAINSRMKTGVTFFYNPANLYPGLPNEKNQATFARWYLGWQAVYYVK